MRIFCKETLTKKVLGLLASCLLFAGCSSDGGTGNTPVTPPSPASALTGVTITGSSAIAATGHTELTASPSTTGTVTDVTYSWQITSGSEYTASLSGTGNKVTLYGNNDDTVSSHVVTVKVTATWNGTSKEASHTVTVAKKDEVVVDSLESLELTAGSTSASASDTVSLTAKAGYYGNPSISYTWALTSGGSYASLAKTTDSRAALSYDEKTNTLTVNNTTAAAQTITVKVTAAYGSTTKEATVNITAAAKPADPVVSKITVYNGITGSSKKGEYDTVTAALAACGSSGDFRIVLPKGTYNENGLTYNGSGTIRICGDTTTKYGADVVIKGHGSTMPVDNGSSAQNARELILFKGTGNLILENLTLQTDWLRSEHPGVSAMQAEVLGFNSSGNVAAYNCSFNSYQDTVRTVGKGWFYNCHIEGDVDFIWMEAGGKVALYEKCDIASVYDGRSSAAYIAAPKINLGNVAGKGVVIKDCTVTAASGQQTYLFRNPWNSDKDPTSITKQYNQAAFVDCTYSGTFVAGLSKSDANGTADQQYIGWKIDSAAASKFTGKSSKIGVLSDDVKSKEYSGRRAILNRNYMVDSAKFEKDTSSFWDIDAFISTVGWSVQTDNSQDKYDGEVETKIYSWDMVANSKPSTGYMACSQDSSVKAYISGTIGSGGCPCFHPGSGVKVYIPASAGDKIEVVTHSGNYYGFKLAGKAASSNAETLTVTETVSSGQSGDTNTYVLLEVTGECYIHSITVTAKGDGTGNGGGETGGGEGSEDLYITFENGPVASDSRVSSASNKIYSDTSYSTYNGVEYTYGVKLNSSGSMIVTLEKAYTVVFVMGTDKSTYTNGLTIDGTVVAPVDNIVTANLAAGTHTIKNGGSETSVYLVILKGAGSATPGGSTTPSTPDPVVTSVTLSKTTLSLTAGGSETISATVNGTNLTDTSVTWSTDASGIATVSNGKITAVAAGTATITAASKADSSKKAACTVTVTAAGGGETPVPSSYDIDVVPGAKFTTYGWADMANSGAGMSYPNTTNIIYIGDAGYKIGSGNLIAYSDTVTKRTAFTNAIASGSVTNSSKKTDAAIIIVEGRVDLSDGKISDTDHSYYDEFDPDTHKRLHNDISFEIGSNKAIIGVKGAQVAFGGLQIKASSNGTTGKNVIIRNIDFWDAHGSTEYDTSAEGSYVESGKTKYYKDSKASADGLVIEASGASGGKYSTLAENIWIDHCKFSDGDCKDLERNYNHDGSFDIKGGKNITISYCEFTNHDKVTLFAPGDDYKFPDQRQITLHHNYYHGATQRMPRSRGCQVHIYNNVYDEIGTSKNAGYTLGPGTGSMFVVENNYFGTVTEPKSLIQYADATTDRNSEYCSKLYQSGNNIEITSANIKWDSAEAIRDASAHLTDTKPWTPAYDYSNMQTNAEAYIIVPDAAGTDKIDYSKTVRVNNQAY